MSKLIYVMGPSGVGKDTVLALSREQCAERSIPAVFAHRYITRAPTSSGENHIALTPEEYRFRHGRGLFALTWTAHELHYAVGIEVDVWLERGLDVVVSGSRELLDEVALRYPGLVPVLIDAPVDIIKRRIENRGRESGHLQQERVRRNRRLASVSHPALVTIENTGEPSAAGLRLTETIVAVHRAV